MLLADVAHAFQFLFLPYTSCRIVRVAEQEGCRLLVGALAFEVFEVDFVGAVADTFQLVFYYFATAVSDAREEAVVHWVCTSTFSPGIQIAFRQQEMAGTTPDV